MALPDVSKLTRAELAELLGVAQERKLILDAAATQNAETLRGGLSLDVDTLAALIGPPAAEAVAGTDSINALLKTPSAAINADPATYFKAGLRLVRKLAKAVLALARVQSGRLESTSTGAE